MGGNIVSRIAHIATEECGAWKHGDKIDLLLTGERAQEQASAVPEQGPSTSDGNGALYAEARTAQVRSRIVDESTEDRAPFHRWAR